MAINLASHTKTGVRIKPPKVALMGVGGIGKTTFAAGATKPYFLFTEEGQGKLDLPRLELREDDPVIRTWDEIMGAVGALYEQEHEHKTLVIDTLDGLEPLLWAKVCEDHNASSIEDVMGGYGKGYVVAADYGRRLLQGLDALRNDRKMAIVLLAHIERKRFEPPDSPAYDRYKLRLQNRFADLVQEWVDVLMFANWKVHVVTETDKRTKSERKRGAGSGERVMYTEERPAHWGKNRYGLPFEMPLSWAAFAGAMAASINPQATQSSASTQE